MIVLFFTIHVLALKKKITNREPFKLHFVLTKPVTNKHWTRSPFSFDVDKWLNISVAEGLTTGVRGTKIGRYTYNEIGGTWDEARKACKKERAHLLTLETTTEWKNVTEHLKALMTVPYSFTHYYIGLRKENGMWKWTEAGPPSVTVASDDSRWQKDEPSSDPREVCAEINSFYRKEYGHFNNVECNFNYYHGGGNTAPRGYICEDM